jgi:beta-aspartyl-peptidase (threonine type)
MKYGKLSLEDACNQFVHETIPNIGGDGGVIAVDSKGNISMPFNTEGMYRACADSEGKELIEIYS